MTPLRTAPWRAPLAMGLAALALAACSKTEPPPEPVRAVRTMLVAKEDTASHREYAAEVKARVESALGFRVGGKIVKRNVELGERVKAQQSLAQLDPQDLRLGQDSARAALSSAQATYALAEADFKRYQELLAKGFISSAELERREATLKSAKAAFDQARAESVMQGNQAGYASLRADADGVITAVLAEPGQVVAAGTPVLRLAHEGARDVVFSVPEDRLAQLRGLEGRQGAVRVKLWGADDTLPATVREVAAAADATTRTVLVKADIGDAPVTLGQTATVIIDTLRDKPTITLPLTALMKADGATSVWLLDPQTMTVQPQPVQVQGADGNAVLIASGLKPGQEVVTAGVHLLTPGQKVRRYAEGGAPVQGDAATGAAAAQPAPGSSANAR